MKSPGDHRTITDLRIEIKYDATDSSVEPDSSSMPTLPVPHSTKSFWHMTHPNDLVNHRTTQTLPGQAQVVIIGSGISGAFAAKELTKLGVKNTVVLEAREICSGATGRNGGHCQALIYGSLPSVSAFELSNFAHLADLVDKSNIPCDFFKYKSGGCHAFYKQFQFDEACAKVSALQKTHPDLGALLQPVSSKPALASLRIPHAVGAVIQSSAAGLHPYKLVTWLWSSLLRSSDINIQTSTPVTSIVRAGSADNWLVLTPRGTVAAANVLLTTNAYTAYLLPELRGLIVPVQGEMSALKPPPSVLDTALEHDYSFIGLMEQDREEDDYLVQRPLEAGGHLMFGGGRMVAKDAAVGVSDDSFVDERVALYLRRMLPKLMDIRGDGKVDRLPDRWVEVEREGDETDMEPLAEWTGVMGYSRDGHPWVGAVPDKKGLWMCGGYTGHGMPNASLSATHAAQLVAAAVQGRDWRRVEQEAVAAKKIPECYVLSERRMQQARQLPEIRSNTAEREASW